MATGTTTWTETVYENETNTIEHYGNWQIQDKPIKGTATLEGKYITYATIDDTSSSVCPTEYTSTVEYTDVYTLESGPWPDLPYPDDPALIRRVVTTTTTGSGFTAIRIGTMEDDGFRVTVYGVNEVTESIEYTMEDTTTYLALSGGGVDYYQVSLNDSASSYTYEHIPGAYINIDGTDYGYTDTSGAIDAAVEIIPAMCKIGDKHAVIYSVSKIGEKTRQFFMWFDDKLTESEIYTIDTSTMALELPNENLLPQEFKDLTNIGFARIGYLKTSEYTVLDRR